MTRRIAIAPTLALVGLLCLSPVVAQEEDAEAQATTPGEVALGEDEGFSAEVSETIRKLMAQEEEALAGEGYGYDAQDRRDPFVSLIVGSRPGPGPGVCEDPDDPTCIRIEGVEITGVFLTSGQAVAQARGITSKRAYLLMVGDQLADGEVLAIELDRVVFRQRVEQAGGVNFKPFREVVKELNP